MQGQSIEVEKRRFDFGLIERGSDRVIDVTFYNRSSQKALVLTTEAEPQYSVLWSKRSVEPDSSIVLRVKFNPRKKGKCKDEISLFFSNMQKPIVLEFQADVAYVDRSDNPACPSFRERPGASSEGDAFIVEVIDSKSGEVLRKARVRIYEQGRLQRDVLTGRDGRYSEEIPIGFYYTLATLEGYKSADSSGYINRRNNFLQLALEPLEQEAPQELAEVKEVPPVEEQEAPEVTVILEEEKPEPAPKPIEASVPEYRPSSLVFLVDVSQSMYYKSRIELLKASVLGLSDALREVDRMALVTYAETTEEVVPLVSVSNKKAIEEGVRSLVAGGRTAGAKGFRKAYGLLELQARAEENRQVILVTDGAFRTMDAQKMTELAEEYAAKGIHTTLVGVRASEAAQEKLAEIARACGGELLLIDELDQGTEVLLREIARRSKITP